MASGAPPSALPDVASKLGSSDYGRLSADSIDLCTQLRALGVASEIKLPTLVTAGNQSSGKSSVVEAIAGIALPRASGTCTRCPTEVRLRRAPPAKGSWLCHVKLKREYDAAGMQLAVVPPEELFCTIKDPADISAYVSAAQATLLNPGLTQQLGAQAMKRSGSGSNVQHSRAYTQLEATGHELEFTPNIVVLELQGADVDLTIVDLPGIIQSHTKGPMYVDVIKNMVIRNIEQDHVVVVMTLTAMDDLENQAINLEARKVDPEGQRTIGVITKPDNVPEGEHDKWLTLARNQNPRQSLALGYYVVKNPGQKQLDDGISSDDARQREMDFFANDPHWSRVHGELGHRLGAQALRDALSDMLVERIQRERPAMRSCAESRLKEINEQFRKLPKKPNDDVEYEFHYLIKVAAGQLTQAVRGTALGDKLVCQRLNNIYQEFQAAIKNSMPVFRVKDTIVTVSEGGENPGEDAVFTLDQVKELRKRHLGYELPSFSPYSAVVELISLFKGRWKAAVEQCLLSAKDELSTVLQQTLEAAFGQFPSMLSLCSNLASQHLSAVADTCWERLARLCGMEERDIFTLNEHYFNDAKDRYLGRLKLANLGMADGAVLVISAEANEALASLSKVGIHFGSLEEVYLAQPTKEDHELHMMAATLAYFKVAYKRIIDQVPLHIRDYFLHEFADELALPRTIHTMVKQSGVELSDLLAEDPEVDNKRRQLTDLKDRLTAAIALLQQPNKRHKRR